MSITRPRQVWLAVLTTFLAGISLRGATYYVSSAGSDSNAGTLSAPWATFAKSYLLRAGDTLLIRGGVYRHSLFVESSGTATSPITIAGYPGEEAVLDGGDVIPTAAWVALATIRGSNCVVRDLTVRQSNWGGLVLAGANAKALRVKSQRNMENGILVTGSAHNSLVEDCEVNDNCRSNEQFKQLRGGWASGLSAARGPNNVTLRRNRVWNNWGEGVSSYEAQFTLIESNVVYNNKLNLYLSDTRFCTVRANLIYCTTNNPCYNFSQTGIGLGDERYTPASSDNVIVNNLLLGNAKNIYYWPGTYGTGGLVRVTIAYNTLVNSSTETNLKLLAGTHADTVVKNNIIVQEGSLPIATVNTPAGISFRHNCWSKTPPSAAAGTRDRVGDPKLARTGDTGPGQLAGDWFRIPGSSVAAASAEPLVGVTTDYFGAPRGTQPDIGGVQHGPAPPANLRVLETPVLPLASPGIQSGQEGFDTL